MYIGFVKVEYEILWFKYLWVTTSPCGGFGGPPPRKFINMKCSRSDSMTIIGLLRLHCVASQTYSLLTKALYLPLRGGGGVKTP